VPKEVHAQAAGAQLASAQETGFKEGVLDAQTNDPMQAALARNLQLQARLTEAERRAGAADTAEAELAQLRGRVAELERATRTAERGKRSAEAHAADLGTVKRERLQQADGAVKAAQAVAGRATAALDDAAVAVAAAEAAAERAADALDDATTCRVCLSEPRELVYAPCFHLAVCRGCHEQMVALATADLPLALRRRKGAVGKPLCPVCRAPAEKTIGRIFT
jgi:hypothetical protein